MGIFFNNLVPWQLKSLGARMLQTRPQHFLSVRGVQAKSAGNEFEDVINGG